MLSAQRAFEAIYANDAGRFDRLFDGAAIESFEPGLPWQWVRWSRNFRERHGVVAVVGRPGPMVSVAATFRYLLPHRRIGIFTDRGAALEFLRTAKFDAA
jgi:hypothetical protein